MRLNKIIIFSCSILILSSCKSTQSIQPKVEGWNFIANIEDVDISIDTASIRHEGLISYASEKRVYLTTASKAKYVDKIRNEYTRMGKPEKANKWNDFSYCIYHCLYECANNRFRILSVEDFDSTGKRIAKTTPPKNKVQWLNVNADTVGDYTFFSVCDYE